MRQTEDINQTRKDKHLNWEERIQIATLQREGLSKAQIGKRLGRPEYSYARRRVTACPTILKRLPNFNPKHDNAWHEYAIEIPADTINGLRIDPAKGAGKIEIKSIRVENTSGVLVKSWEF